MELQELLLEGPQLWVQESACFCEICWQQSVKTAVLGFPAGPVAKNLPASAGGMDVIPGLRRCHTPQGN